MDPYGRKLFQICGDRGLTILNGCTLGDSQGYFTYEKGPIRSVIDYAMVSQSIWPLVRNFQVDQHNPFLSDRSLICLELNLNGSQNILQPPNAGRSPLLKFDWSQESMDRFRLRLSSPPFTLQLQLLEARLAVENPDINEIVNDFSNLLLDETKQVVKFRKRGPFSKKQKSARNWYNNSLRNVKSEIHQMSLKLLSNPSHHYLQLVQAKTKAYKSLLMFKARKFKQLQGTLQSASEKSPKEWWSHLQDLKSKMGGSRPTCLP